MFRSNRLPIIAALVGLVLILIYSSVFVVNERQQAIVLRFGEIQSVKKEPGLYFKAPFAFAGFDNVQIIEDRLLRLDLNDQPPVQVSGGRFYEVDAFLTFRIADARRFREQVSGDLTAAASRLRTRFDAALRRVYGLRSFEAALSDERTEMMRQVRDLIRPDAETLGLQIEDVRIVRTDLTKEVSQQTYDRMKAERLAEAERIRARGRETARRIRAVADRQVVEILADARRESEIVRGKGDAKRNSIFADAFNRDPQFFDFYRSMAAYQAGLENSDTTLVLSPTSEFFRYFKDAGGAGLDLSGKSVNPDAPGPVRGSGDTPSAGESGSNSGSDTSATTAPEGTAPDAPTDTGSDTGAGTDAGSGSAAGADSGAASDSGAATTTQ